MPSEQSEIYADSSDIHPTLRCIKAYARLIDLFSSHERTYPEDTTAVIEGFIDRLPGQKYTFQENMADFGLMARAIREGVKPQEAIARFQKTRELRTKIHTLLMLWDEKAYSTIVGGQRGYKVKGVALSVSSHAQDGVELLRTGTEIQWSGLDHVARQGERSVGDYFDQTWDERLLRAYLQAGRGTNSHLHKFEGHDVPFVQINDLVPGKKIGKPVYGRILHWPKRWD